MKLWSRGCVLVGCAMLAAGSLAQQWKAEVPAVEKAGVYAILLSPEMVGRSLIGAEDLRIKDQVGSEVPYIFTTTKPRSVVVDWEPFKILRNGTVDSTTVVDLEKPEGEPFIEQIRLTLRNAMALKSLRITGSDDRAEWFHIKEDMLVASGLGGHQSTAQQILTIPTSDYKYLRLTLNDNLTHPVRIVSAEWQYATSSTGTWTRIDGVKWISADSAGITRIRVTCPYPTTMERVEFVLGDTGRYLRNGAFEQLVERSTGRGQRRRISLAAERVATFRLSSDGPALVDLPTLKQDTFSIIIENGDDRPLSVRELNFQQLQRVVLAELQPGQHYTITTGDPKKQAPQYDLAHFKDQLPAPIATLNHGQLIAIPSVAHDGPAVQPSRWWIWAGLVAVLGLVGFMAVRMLREPPSNN